MLTVAALQAQNPKVYEVQPGTRIPLSLVNSVGAMGAAPGDPVYLQTTFPIVVDGRIAIPAGSYVSGAVTDVKRAGRVKGRSEIHLRFHTLTLPNGVVRDFGGKPAGLDAGINASVDRDEGLIQSRSNVGGDAKTVAIPAAAGASVGASAGGIVSRTGLPFGSGGWNGTAQGVATGAGIGAGVGAGVGIAVVLLTRGPEVVLARGTSVDMVLDRVVKFEEAELSSSSPGGIR